MCRVCCYPFGCTNACKHAHLCTQPHALTYICNLKHTHRCPVGIAMGVVVLLLIPVCFAFFATLHVRRFVRDGQLKFEENPKPSFAELKVRSAADLFALVRAWDALSDMNTRFQRIV